MVKTRVYSNLKVTMGSNDGEVGTLPSAANGEAPKSRADMTEAEKSELKAKKKAAKLAKQEEKKRKKAEAASAAAAAANVPNPSAIDYLKDSEECWGEYAMVRSQGKSERKFMALEDLEKMVGDGSEEKHVWVRVRVAAINVTSKVVFLVIRRGMETMQAVVDNKAMIKWMKKFVNAESIADVFGTLKVPVGGKVEKCTVGGVEIAVEKLFLISKAEEQLPFTLEDARRVEEDESKDGAIKDGEKQVNLVSRETRLNSRVVDLRVPPHVAIMRIQSGVCRFFRQFLTENGFTEIHSPKLIAGASEGGADVFKLDYMGRDACLAQSPQLYKQMAICGDMRRVFEIGPVFRAEKSDTHRHLCEFTGLDLEMEIVEHYDEVLDIIDKLFVAIFNGLNKVYARELESVKSKWDVPPFCYESGGGKTLQLEYPQAVAMLREADVEIGDFENMNTPMEKALGKLVKEKYGTDFFILKKYPSAVRPFYTMVDPTDGNYSNSFDVFMRGEEIISGAQRIHDLDLLKTRATAMLGEEGVASISAYVDAFRYGAPPHGGCGVGLERVVMLFLGVGNIRECSMFPRDPKRLTP